MPKTFSAEDRAAIRRSLIEHGREQFLRYGLRRTKVEELARASGIAKGTFYHFFDSKEDLCLTIYDEEEERLAGRISEIVEAIEDPKEVLVAIMRYSADVIRGDSLLMRLRETGEYAMLARGVGKEKLESHQTNDVGPVAAVLENLRNKGCEPRVEPEVLAAVFRAVTMLSFHEREIGESLFPTTIEIIVESIADRIIGKGKNE